MLDTLRTIAAVIDNNTVTIRTFLVGDLRRHEQQVTENAFMRCVRFRQTRQAVLPLGNAQNMRRRLRIDVAKAKRRVVLINDIRRNVAAQQFVENGRTIVIRLLGRLLGLLDFVVG